MATITYTTAGAAAAMCALNEGETVLAALERHGPCPQHRTSFMPVRQLALAL